MKRGDVVLIAWPFTDLSLAKVRPAVIVSSDRYNRGSDRILVAVSSKVDAPSAWDVVAQPTDPEYPSTGLYCASLFKCGKLLTLNAGLIKRRLGTVGSQYLGQIEKGVHKALGLR